MGFLLFLPFLHRRIGFSSRLKPAVWRRLCAEGRIEEACQALVLVGPQKSSHFKDMLYRLLKGCIAKRNIVVGSFVHDLAVKSGLETDVFLGNHIIRMYASHGRLLEAYEVFRKLLIPTIFVWTSIISAHSEHGKPEMAINLYRQMRLSKTRPDDYVFVAVLKACARATDLASGRLVHADIMEYGFESHKFVGNILVDMYSKCGDIEGAQKVFDRLPSKDLVTWSAMIAGYAQHGLGHEALRLHEMMQHEGMLPDAVAFVHVLKACCSVGGLQIGKRVHGQIVGRGLEADVFVANKLIDMYAKYGSLGDARAVFDKLPVKTVVTWNAMIAGYAQNGSTKDALELYESMQLAGIVPDSLTFVSILKVCTNLVQGKEVHAQILERSLEAHAYVANTVVDMYIRCGSLDDARKVFDSLSIRNVVTWNAMIAGYAQNGLYQEALNLYASMHKNGVEADKVTFMSTLRACGTIGALQTGKGIHDRILGMGLEADVFVANTLVDMYAKCGALKLARLVFDRLPCRDMVTWNIMIVAYAQQGFPFEALHVYAGMQQVGMTPDNVTLASVLKACGSLEALNEVKQIHSDVLEKGLEGDGFIMNSLLNSYVKCGQLEDARILFDSLPKKDVVTWNGLIAGYAQRGGGHEALHLFLSMQQAGISPDMATYVSVLKVCGSMGAIEEGRQLHAQIIGKGLEVDVLVGSSLMDMYVKCGSLNDAHRVFDNMPENDVVLWTALIDGYARHNDCRMAIKCFEKMQQQGVEPDAATFTCILSACSHVGLVAEGKFYFKRMAEEHGINPSIEHYNCMVDLLGRSGCLEEAESVLGSMPFGVNSVVGYTSLLNACKLHGNKEMARCCFDRLIQLEPNHGSAYALMADMYADVGRLEDSYAIDSMRRRAGAQKKPASAVIEVNCKAHEFMVGETRDDTTLKLRSLNMFSQDNHVAESGGVVMAIDKEQEDALCGHAEKLALAFGLLNTAEGTPLLVNKNLRMCTHCHRGTKMISRIENREIIVRDAHRVHHFKDGVCSCGDYR